MESLLGRHARACRGHPRLSFDASAKEGVDGRDKPGHDDVEVLQNEWNPL
jgi:hypothetical protein